MNKQKLILVIICTLFVCFVGVVSFRTGYEYNPIPTFSNAPNRPLNTSFRPNLYKAAIGTYTVSINTAVSLLNLNSSGVVYLEISQDNTNWITINSAGVTRTLAVSLSVGLNETTNFNVQGVVPAGWWGRLRTVTSGGATVSFSSGQEVMY